MTCILHNIISTSLSLSLKVKRRSRLLSQLFQSYRPYDHKLGERQCVLVTEESHDGVHYVAHNRFYEQVCEAHHETSGHTKGILLSIRPALPG